MLEKNRQHCLSTCGTQEVPSVSKTHAHGNPLIYKCQCPNKEIYRCIGTCAQLKGYYNLMKKYSALDPQQSTTAAAHSIAVQLVTHPSSQLPATQLDELQHPPGDLQGDICLHTVQHPTYSNTRTSQSHSEHTSCRGVCLNYTTFCLDCGNERRKRTSLVYNSGVTLSKSQKVCLVTSL